MSLQTRCSAKESGHSLEFNSPLQTREHSLLVIRIKKRALDRLCSRQGFHSPCCKITWMHLHCTEKAYSCSLEFCLGGFIKINAVIFLQPECCIVCLLCVSYVVFVSFCSQQKESEVVQLLSATPWTVAFQVPLSMGFSRQDTGEGNGNLLQYLAWKIP